jgi:hypothetical protein
VVALTRKPRIRNRSRGRQTTHHLLLSKLQRRVKNTSSPLSNPLDRLCHSPHQPGSMSRGGKRTAERTARTKVPPRQCEVPRTVYRVRSTRSPVQVLTPQPTQPGHFSAGWQEHGEILTELLLYKVQYTLLAAIPSPSAQDAARTHAECTVRPDAQRPGRSRGVLTWAQPGVQLGSKKGTTNVLAMYSRLGLVWEVISIYICCKKVQEYIHGVLCRMYRYC